MIAIMSWFWMMIGLGMFIAHRYEEELAGTETSAWDKIIGLLFCLMAWPIYLSALIFKKLK